MLLRLSKFCLAVMILFSAYFQVVFFAIPGLIPVLGFIALLSLLIVIYRRATPLREGISIEIILWAAFALTSLFVGYIIGVNPTFTVVSVVEFMQNLLIITMICFICKYDGDVDFIVQIFIVLAFLCAITTAFWGEPFQGGLQISMTAATNPNELGLVLVFGIICLLYRLNIYKKLSILLVTSGVALFLYTIILTASRKSLFAAIFILIYWLIFVFGGTIRNITLSRKTVAVATLVLMGIGLVYFMIPIFQGSTMLERLSTAQAGDEYRIGLYQEAYKFFVSSPLFGIGFNNFRLLSVYGVYTHSTYAEAFACTGLLGAILYFSAYITMTFKTIRVIIDKGIDNNIRMQARNILGTILVMVALGAGVIHFYSLDASLIFAIIIGFNKLNYKPAESRLPD